MSTDDVDGGTGTDALPAEHAARGGTTEPSAPLHGNDRVGTDPWRRRRPRWRSVLSLGDVFGESWLEVSRRPLRTVLTGLGVALGVAAVVATSALVDTIRFQVSDEFDALLATQVEVRTRDLSATAATAAGGTAVGGFAVDPDSAEIVTLFPPPAAALERVRGLDGVEGIAVLRDSRHNETVALSNVVDASDTTHTAPVRGVNAAGLAAVGADVTGTGWDSWHDRTGQRVALLGRRTADDLGLARPHPGQHVYISGVPFTLLGIIESTERASGLRNGVVVPATTAALFEMDLERDRVIAVTAPGAAKAVEAALPLALAPEDPELFRAYSPAQSQDLRRAVDDQIQYLALALGAVVMVLGVVSIGNATLTSVLQRINEIGIRRALGARPRHIAAHIVCDAGLVGAVGGALGALVGLTATLAVTAHRGWEPVIDMRIPLAAILVGAAAGAVAGLYPAWVGSRLQPTEALRRE